MYIVFLSVLFILLAADTAVAFLSEKKYKGVVITEKNRCRGYCQLIAWLWGLVLAVFIMCLIGNISFEDIGFRLISLKRNIWFTVVTFIFSGLLFAFALQRAIPPLISAKAREEIKKQLETVVGGRWLFPRSKKEKWLFSLLSLSAGICEEIVFRGFPVYLLQVVFPGMPIFLIVLIPSVMFGISHLYQGLQGTVGTMLIGALYMCLFLTTDSLILPMLLHFFLDLSGTFLLSEEQT